MARSGPALSRPVPYGTGGKPYVRWWWFASEVKRADIDQQLSWLCRNGFGGVELCFTYARNENAPVHPFLGPEWQDAVAYCAAACRCAGLGFDLTFGSLWPFGGSMVNESDASRNYRGLSCQRLTRSWESAEGKEPGLIVNHLDRGALERYAAVIAPALAPALGAWTEETPPSQTCFFCDSWEVRVDGLWTDGMGDRFASDFGYRLEPYLDRLDEEPEVRYDYRRLLARMVLEEFYRPFTDICHEYGALSRVQCHGAPTDLIAAYAAVDIPESETLLFDPPFSAFAASAAAQAGLPVVACESFSCLYGWRRWPGPGPHQTGEHWPDIRLTADAMFANGVNHLIWHGMPFREDGSESRFYASVHVGPDAAFAEQLPALNAYLARMSRLMQQGVTYAPLAVYQPLEDVFRMGRLADADKRPSAEYHWEMQYVRFPDETRPYRPIWTSEHFLSSSRVDDGQIILGAHRTGAIYVTSRFLHEAVLHDLVRLALDGACIVLTSDPRPPGRQPVPGYRSLLEQLRSLSLSRLADVPPSTLLPVVTGRDLPEFAARVVGGACGDPEGTRLRLFFAHPATGRIRYPMPYRYSDQAVQTEREVTIHWAGKSTPLKLEFGPGEAIVAEVDRSGDVSLTYGNQVLAEYRHALLSHT